MAETKLKNKLMCEVMAQDVLPAVRAIMSRELINEHKMSQSDAAQLIGVSQPAVSQYMRQLRGSSGIITDEKIHADIKNLCVKMKDRQVKEQELMQELDNICRMAAAVMMGNAPAESISS